MRRPGTASPPRPPPANPDHDPIRCLAVRAFPPPRAQAPYADSQYKLAIAERGVYRAAGNLFWLDLLWSTQPGVPIRRCAIQELREHYFTQPGVYNFPVIVGVFKGVSPMDLRGRMHRVSPEEPVMAIILQLASELESGVDEARVRAWRTMVLSVSFTWKLLESDDAQYWESVRERERLVVDYSTMSRSAVQRIFELAAFRAVQEKKTGKISHSDLAQLYNQHAQMAKQSEPITENTVKNAAVVYRDMLRVLTLLDRITLAEETYGRNSPFDSILKLHIIATKVQAVFAESLGGQPGGRGGDVLLSHAIDWVLAGIMDLVAAKHLATSDIGTRVLKGDGSGGKGLVDLLLLKFFAKPLLLGPFLDDRTFPAKTKAVIRDVMASHTTYRAYAGYPWQTSHDLQWKAGWPDSSLHVCKLVEAPRRAAPPP